MQSSKPIADRPSAWRLVLPAIYLGGLAYAYPDASPWGSANPDSDESCSSCHYDFEPIHDSGALQITGLPASVSAGQKYDLVLKFDADDASVSGFQAISTAGEFMSADETLEPAGTAIRSIQVRNVDNVVEWKFSWQAPHASVEAITMYVAASAANADQSPLGDTVHYRQLEIPLRR